jgi:hypothetical protein
MLSVSLLLSLALAGQTPAPAELLQKAGAYLAEYERQISAVVLEENYKQIAKGDFPKAQRNLRSDLLVISGGDAGWFGFRDVLAVDGNAIPDHENRLLKLVTAPSANAMEQWTRMSDEGARYNLGGGKRTINMPTIALIFLRAAEQERSRWTVAGRKKIEGYEVIELRFAEQAMPRIVRTSDDAAASGRFWIEPDSGRIVRSEFVIDSMGMFGSVTVTFGPAPKVVPWMPLAMEDLYHLREVSSASAASRETTSILLMSVEGHASYKNFRTFNVNTSEIIKK